jgi:hypothetical protein
MTDPYINNLPKGATWSEGKALDTETREDGSISHVTTPQLSDNDRMLLGLSEVMGEFREQMKKNLQGRISGEFQLPSEEVMRREIESGVFSPESIEITQRIQKEAELYNPDQDADDFGANEAQRLDDLEARKARMAEYDTEQSRLYQEKLDMGLLVGSGVKPDVKEIASHFVKKMDTVTTALKEAGETAQKTTTAFREVGEKIGRVKKEYVRPDHLTHRPFKTHEMQILREQLRGRS